MCWHIHWQTDWNITIVSRNFCGVKNFYKSGRETSRVCVYLFFVEFNWVSFRVRRWDSSVGIATRYGPDGTGIECGWGRDFPHQPHRPRGPPSLLYNGYRLFPGGKAAGAWRDHNHPSSAEVKERVELYLYSPSGPSWPVLGWTVPLPDSEFPDVVMFSAVLDISGVRRHTLHHHHHHQ